MRAYGLTDRGVKRGRNEDSILVDHAVGLYIVADGMGGYADGDVASAMAVTVIGKVINERLPAQSGSGNVADAALGDAIKDAIAAAHREVLAHSRTHHAGSVIGTTVTLALLRGERLFTAHIGDSRLYRLRGGAFDQLTTDHTKARELVEMGLLSKADAENHRSSHVLTRALGASESVTPDLAVHALMPGDRYLLSTDGMFRVLSVDMVRQVVAGAASPEDKCRTLVEFALQSGAPDNVSVIVLEAEKKRLWGWLVR